MPHFAGLFCNSATIFWCVCVCVCARARVPLNEESSDTQADPIQQETHITNSSFVKEAAQFPGNLWRYK